MVYDSTSGRLADAAPAHAPPRLAWAITGMALVAIIPFLAARIPSMTDLPGHTGRYAVMLDHGRSPLLAAYYSFDWRVIGNLGVDLFVAAFGWLGAERAAWLGAAIIAPLTILAMATVSRTLHGRVQPGALAAACFAMANPLMFGFVNYCLSLAFALFAFAAWVRWREAPAWRVMPPLALAALLTWLAHAVGWGVLVLLVGGFELDRLWQRRSDALGPTLRDALLRGLALAPPVVLTLAWRGDGGALVAWGDDLLVRKAMNWVVVLRGEAKWIDLATPALLALACLATWRRQAIDWRLFAGALLLALAVMIMPTVLFGSWGADERLAPAAVIAALLSLRWQAASSGAASKHHRSLAAFVTLALALFGIRTLMIARDWHRLDRDYAAHLTAIDRLPRGAHVFAVVLQDRCHTPWQSTAYVHLASLAIGRRQALVNTQWLLPGAAMLKVRYPLDPRYANDPSQMVDGFDCNGRLPDPLAQRRDALASGQWQYLWVLQTHGTDPWRGHRPVYRDGNSVLYRLPTT
ncbi:hypothetical protein [Sphingomonas dokdonensis]|uniref:Glycosyltransferase RgtA/B/C/D-like domain-containing protein n=1 Tax=Sphingomonas dokdonensis TaxID=344880 RepID=A0A245ZGE0_9SPHN|nr:hypothetical protein [Sphingomonas dokdonensis]OWK28802.1 hypothetical protein SPDO_26370 [Sphingomonas dokdonensis]